MAWYAWYGSILTSTTCLDDGPFAYQSLWQGGLCTNLWLKILLLYLYYHLYETHGWDTNLLINVQEGLKYDWQIKAEPFVYLERTWFQPSFWRTFGFIPSDILVPLMSHQLPCIPAFISTWYLIMELSVLLIYFSICHFTFLLCCYYFSSNVCNICLMFSVDELLLIIFYGLLESPFLF